MAVAIRPTSIFDALHVLSVPCNVFLLQLDEGVVPLLAKEIEDDAKKQNDRKERALYRSVTSIIASAGQKCGMRRENHREGDKIQCLIHQSKRGLRCRV